MSVKIFLSTVSAEFRVYRDYLRSDLTRHNVEVKVQEDFKDQGRGTLDELDVYIAHCDAVAHLVGHMTGAAPGERDVSALLAKHSGLTGDLPPLGEALKNGESVSYTQWEAWLALYHRKDLFIAQAAESAERGPEYVSTDVSCAAQAAHLARLEAAERFPGCTFISPVDLANYIKSTAILDLLVKDDTEAIRQNVERLTAELSLSNAQREALVGELAKVKAEFSGTANLVSGFLETMVDRKVAPEQFAVTLFKIAGDWKSAGEKIDALSFSGNLSPRLSRLRDRAKAAHEAGRLDEAEELLAGIANVEIDALKRLEDHEREILEEIRLRKRGVADTKVAQAAVAHARLNYRHAAALYDEAASLVESIDPERRRTWLFAQAGEFFAQGEEFGDKAALEEAVALYRRNLLLAPRSEWPRDWAATQMNLGTALFRLGEGEAGTVRLEEAIATYREALRENTRSRVPLEWAWTQVNIGDALTALGERESDPRRLEEAVAAYHEALQEYNRARMPLEWAMAQMNLGNALVALGTRESGPARLKEAVTAYREALKEQTRLRVPLRWAMNQMNLGVALEMLGRREGGTARLEEAITAYREALKEQTRLRVPLRWARTQMNIGDALTDLGERESGTARLEEAVTAYREALHERTRARVPLDWARTQMRLGRALSVLGERESDPEQIEEAVVAYREALQEVTRVRVPLEWALIQMNLGNALFRLGEEKGDPARLEESITAYREALKEQTRLRVPLDWATTQVNLGTVLTHLGESESGTALLDEAVSAYREALQVLTRARVPLQWAMTQHNLALVYHTLNDKDPQPRHIDDALEAADRALEEFRRANAAFYIENAERLRGNILALKGKP